MPIIMAMETTMKEEEKQDPPPPVSSPRHQINEEEEEEDEEEETMNRSTSNASPTRAVTMAGVGAPTSTPISSSHASQRLSVVGDGSFEQLMRERTKLRKEKDEHSVAELRVQMTSMERALAQEVKRRIDATALLERQCSQRVSDMERRLTDIIDRRSSLLQSRIDDLHQKVQDLHTRFEEERHTIPQDIERRGEELSDLVSQFREELRDEKRSRLNREGRIMKQMQDLDDVLRERCQSETQHRERALEELRMLLETNEEERTKSDLRLREVMDRELKVLQDAMDREVKERKLEDDEIVAALNRYTDHLQASLSVISSD